MTTPAWKPNRIFSFCEEWDDQGNGEIIPRPTLLCSLSQHQYSRFAFHRRPALLSFKLKKLARKHVSSFYFLSEPPPRTGLVSPFFFFVFFPSFPPFLSLPTSPKKCQAWSSHCSTAELNLTGIHEDAGLIPGPTQWLRIRLCCELWCRWHMWLGSLVAVAVAVA